MFSHLQRSGQTKHQGWGCLSLYSHITCLSHMYSYSVRGTSSYEDFFFQYRDLEIELKHTL